MKNVVFGFALFFSASVFAQKTDTATVSVTTEIGQLEEQELVKDYVFLTQKNARYLFKVNLFQNAFGIDRTYSRSLLAFEAKIGQQFSVNFGGSIGGIGAVGEGSDSLIDLTVVAIASATIEPRFYYRQAQRIRDGRSGNNLSDNYISLFGQKNFFFGTGSAVDSLLRGQQNLRFGVGWGIQRRIFKRGYFDIGLLGTLTRVGFDAPKWYFGLAPRAVLGLGFGPEKYSASDAAQCAALRCFVEENRQTRLNLIDLFGFSTVPGSEFLTSKLTAEHEMRLGKTARSANFGLIGHGERGKTFSLSGSQEPFESAGLVGSVEFRKYYRMKKKVRQGESALNFSGPFTVWRAEAGRVWRREQRLVGGEKIWDRNDEASAGLGWGWGYQRRILEHGYFSFKAVFVVKREQIVGETGWYWDSQLQLPVAFGLSF